MMDQRGRAEGKRPSLQGQAGTDHLPSTNFGALIPLQVLSDCWMKSLSQMQAWGVVLVPLLYQTDSFIAQKFDIDCFPFDPGKSSGK